MPKSIMVCVLALMLFSNFIQQCYCFQFQSPDVHFPGSPASGKKTDLKISNMKKSFDDKMSEVSETMQQMNASFIKENEHFEVVKRYVEDIRRNTNERLESMKEELTKTNKRLQTQCLMVDQMNKEIQGSKKFDGYPMLAFENAYSSSIYNGLPISLNATNAIDGNLNTNLRKGSCVHTNSRDPSPWWLGSLSRESEIHRLELTDRTDCCSGRLNHILVQVFETDPRNDPDAEPKLCQRIKHTEGYILNVTCDTPLTGKYIRIYKTIKQVFHLCEVRAFGFVDKSHKFGIAIQSSDVADAKLATDGNPKTCSETQNEEDSDTWWQVDLLGETTLTGLTLTNRVDKKYIFLSDFEVRVSKNFPSVCGNSTHDVCTSFKDTVGQGESVTLTCEKPMTGRYLKIRKLNGGTLSICDVKLEILE